MKDMANIPEGALFTVSIGAYSNYYVMGVFRAKAEINAVVLREEWLANHPDQAEEYAFKEDDFLAWVAGKDLIEAIDSWEWHLADYSRASEMTVGKVGDDDWEVK